ncbi:CGA synthase-related protein [Kitasatospora sp. NPDC004669]|uniref:CGA synthase-related protein n=1 Tax=Kitasatospora sp. NPDC004669 TaxID=3154555 RepID=UPI0033B35571
MAVLTNRASVLLACREEQLDSLLALRRIAAHLRDLPRFDDPPGLDDLPHLDDPSGLGTADAEQPAAALVCDDEAVTARLTRLGVPVLHLSSALPEAPATGPATGSAEGLLTRAHWPGWLDRPPGIRPTGLLAPARLTRNRDRRGTLLLISLWGLPTAEAEAFTDRRLPALVGEAVRRTGSCTVICDTSLDQVRAATAHLPDTTTVRAADTDVDARHAEAELLLASPTMAALALARARRAPLAFLPPLGPAQRALAERVAHLVPVPTADPADPTRWEPPPAEVQWAGLGPDLDDLRGAQALARTVRQLLLAPP